MGSAVQPDIEMTQVGHAHSVELRLLGGFDVLVCGNPVRLPESSRRVVGYLALHSGPQPRVVVAGNLWPEKSDERAAANLRSSLWRVRCQRASRFIDADGPSLRLASHVCVDIETLQNIGWNIVKHRSIDNILNLDSRLFYASLLPGWYDDWVIFERERLAQLQLHSLDALVEALIHAGRHGEAVDTAIRLLAADPLRERSHLDLVAAYAAEGNLGLAQRQYCRYSELLAETFGCSPDISFSEAARVFAPLPDISYLPS
jgi:DNA-binding SARP family transcriptional activator